jgi:hypothetical protein
MNGELAVLMGGLFIMEGSKMCCKNGGTCPQCDPGIEAFYQEKLKEAKAMTVAHFAATGIHCIFEDNLDAKDIWYEYCDLKRKIKAPPELPEYHEAEQAKEFIENEELGMRMNGWIDYPCNNCICVNSNTCIYCFYQDAQIMLKYFGMYPDWADKAEFEYDLRMEDELEKLEKEFNQFYYEMMGQEYDSSDTEGPCWGLWTEQDELMRLNDIAAVEREEIA